MRPFADSRRAALAGGLAITLASAACAGDAASTAHARTSIASFDTVAAPAAERSGEPNLTTGPDGIYMTWLEQTDEDRYALRFARWDGRAWSEPGTVMDRTDLFVNWADFPALAVLEDGTLAAHWLQKSGPGTYSYDVRMALSRDSGRTWSDDIIPHQDGVEAEHGFVSLHPLEGQVAVAWLDGRETVHGDPMTLRFATVAPDGSLDDSTLLDASVCDCCQTGMAVTDDGPIVVYRDRTADEVRDIAITRHVDGAWTEPRIIHEDGWVIPGCPVNGPSVAARGQRVAVAWFTGAPLDARAERADVRQAGEQGRVMAAFSEDGGATFGPPVRVDDGEAMGRVDLELLEDGSALVAWLERVDGAAEVRVRQVDEGGAGTPTTVAGTAAQRASGFPRIAVSGDQLMFAWTEAGDGGRVRTALARLEDG